MSLNVDLSQVTGFTSCTTDYTNNNTETCTDSPTGTIAIDFKKPAFPIQASVLFSRNRVDLGRMTMFLMGEFDNTDAITNATAFGVTFPRGHGVIGTSRQMMVTIERNP